MNWKILKLLSVVVSLIGIIWFAGGQHGFIIGFLLLIIGVGLFILGVSPQREIIEILKC